MENKGRLYFFASANSLGLELINNPLVINFSLDLLGSYIHSQDIEIHSTSACLKCNYC